MSLMGAEFGAQGISQLEVKDVVRLQDHVLDWSLHFASKSTDRIFVSATFLFAH